MIHVIELRNTMLKNVIKTVKNWKKVALPKFVKRMVDYLNVVLGQNKYSPTFYILNSPTHLFPEEMQSFAMSVDFAVLYPIIMYNQEWINILIQ